VIVIGRVLHLSTSTTYLGPSQKVKYIQHDYGEHSIESAHEEPRTENLQYTTYVVSQPLIDKPRRRVSRITIKMPSDNTTTTTNPPTPIISHLNTFLATRHPPKTFCPSEVARSLSQDELRAMGCDSWRDAMPEVRRLVYELRDEGGCEVLQKGVVVMEGEQEVRGPIRVRRGEGGGHGGGGDGAGNI